MHAGMCVLATVQAVYQVGDVGRGFRGDEYGGRICLDADLHGRECTIQ